MSGKGGESELVGRGERVSSAEERERVSKRGRGQV